jgi:hypothetical protein
VQPNACSALASLGYGADGVERRRAESPVEKMLTAKNVIDRTTSASYAQQIAYNCTSMHITICFIVTF